MWKGSEPDRKAQLGFAPQDIVARQDLSTALENLSAEIAPLLIRRLLSAPDEVELGVLRRLPGFQPLAADHTIEVILDKNAGLPSDCVIDGSPLRTHHFPHDEAWKKWATCGQFD